ncbi:RimK family alpha-L-glutamate ligase [Paracoccus sp. (in: a-proteobacteria)]|uniref:ATP-grasp domain-containing protein n=1 Tax=Paracoccus sp. TaxID=267 RepID=UPI0035AF1B5A
MILIISFLDNEHVRRVIRHLTMPYEIVDLSWFPSRMQMQAFAGRDTDAFFLDLPDGRRLALDEVGAVWHRRIRAFTLDAALTDEVARTFAWSECSEALDGIWHGMDCFWMNPPHADERALKKVYQHRLARRVGLRIPETLVTNSPDEARAFIERHAATGVIRKAFRNIQQAPRATLKVGPEELRQIDAVRFAPVIFQEYIPLALDLRVTVIDGEIFTTGFRSTAEYEVDYRGGIGSATVAPYDLPDEVSQKLLEMMQQMELRFGAVDFRLTPEGEHVFFEINPAGEYLFCVDRTGQPIPEAIAATLERHARAHGR